MLMIVDAVEMVPKYLVKRLEDLEIWGKFETIFGNKIRKTVYSYKKYKKKLSHSVKICAFVLLYIFGKW